VILIYNTMASQLTNVIELIHQDIHQTSKDVMHIIYVGVGAAAGMFNSNGLIDEQNYHEYPPFLQKIQEQINSAHIHIVLIDPILGNPPYSINDHSKGLHYIQNDTNFYTAKSNTENIFHVYCIRESVYIDGQYYHDGFINITQDLYHLNDMCMQESILMIYNDYTGRENKYVAEFYDDQINGYLDHIIYGIGARKEFGCYIDLLSIESQFAFKITERNRRMIKVLNIFNYLLGGYTIYNINSIIQEYDIENVDKISSQISCVIDQYISEFKNKSLYILKSIHRLIHLNDLTQIEFIILNINHKHRSRVELMIKNHSYQELQTYMKNIFARELDIICKLKDNGLTGHDLITFITQSEDPLQWYNQLGLL